MSVVLGSIFGLIALLAWVGWRFFYINTLATDGGLEIETVIAAPPPPVRAKKIRDRAEIRFGRSWIWPLLMVITTGAIVMTTLHQARRHPMTGALPAESAPNRHMQLALTEEILVPPPPLPPLIFMQSERPSLAGADRDWSKLEPKFVQQVLRLIAAMDARGYHLVLLEGYRSPERQNTLAESGRGVTQARAFQSKHQYGLAVDLAPMRDGRIVLSERDPWALAAYKELGVQAEELGLTWGGRWTFRDFGHVESKITIASLNKR